MQVKIIDYKALSKQELEQKYLQVFGYSAPKGYTKSYLIKEIVWQEQYKSLPNDLQHKLDLLVSDYEKTKSINIKKIKNFEVTTGTKFIREYKGERYEVTAVENGFQYKDQTYKTLSAVANVITGTHWNGKKFFGLLKPECTTRTVAVSRRSSAKLNDSDVGLQTRSVETHRSKVANG